MMKIHTNLFCSINFIESSRQINFSDSILFFHCFDMDRARLIEKREIYNVI